MRGYLPKMRWRTGYLILGILFILTGFFLPRDWYDALPKNTEVSPPPIKGVTLVQISLLLDGLIVIWLSLRDRIYTRLDDVERFSITAVSEIDDTVNKYTAQWILAGITLLALFLRLFHINSDLWLDEITPILDYGRLSPLQVVATYISTNNHLLNTLLGKLSIACFGEKEWVIRLPAVIFGTATVPAIWWVARSAMSRTYSLLVALILAVSYHHIFFSQNARGYSGYLFFSVIAAGLLIKGLKEDQARIWLLYVIAMFFNFASLLISGFVLAAHILIGAVAVLAVKYRGGSPLPLIKRLGAVFGLIAFLVFQLYAAVLPQVYMFIREVYTGQSSGFAFFSLEFASELIRGISAGFGTGFVLGAVPFLIIAGAGFVTLVRRHWILAASLAMPVALNALFLLVRGLTFSPRFFLLALMATILSAVLGLKILSELAAKILRKSEGVFSHRLAIALVLMVCAVSLSSLKYYYSVPKQAYRASIQYLEEKRKPDGIVMVIDIAEKGYRYYGKQFGLKEDKEYFFVRTMEAIDAVLSANSGKRSFLVTTFPRALHLNSPDIESRIKRGWTVIHTFRGTIGDGQISVWAQRNP